MSEGIGIKTEIDKFGKRVTLLVTAVVGATMLMSSMSLTAKATEGNSEGSLGSAALGQAIPGASEIDAGISSDESAANEENNSQEEKTEHKLVQNNKVDFGGWGLTSTLDGCYTAEGVSGIAMLDYEFNLRSQANMSPVEFFYVTTWDITQDTAPLAVNTFRLVAQSQNAILGPVFQININKKISGKMYSLEGSPVCVNTMVGIPDDFKNPGAKYAVVCVKSGGVFEIIPDTDNYDNMVTFSAKAGDAAYALICY